MFWRDQLYLWVLLPAVAALGAGVFFLLRRRAAVLAKFADAASIGRLAPDADRRRLVRGAALRIAALALIAVALAGPEWGFRWQEVRRQGLDLIIALDTSRSMLATDVKPNRLERAKLAILDLVPLLQGDRTGLVAYAGTAFLECPLTLDYAAFERSLRAVDVGIIPRGGTAIGRAIDASLAAFEARQSKYEAIILITDGEDHEGDVKAATERAAAAGVKIFTVGIGTPEGELLPVDSGSFVKDRRGQVVKSRLDEETLKEIALGTGGAYVHGLGPRLGLDEVFRDHIATMERREVASSIERRNEERFQIPLALALLLLAVELLLPRRRLEPRARRWRWSPRGRSRAAVSLLVLALPALAGWFDPPGDRAAEGNRLYEQGQYEAAASKYNEGLIDAPASPLLQFNLGDALYKEGKFAEAIAAFAKAASSGETAWVARANYNMGDAFYRLGAAAEEKEPQAAIGSYEQALAAYRRGMVADSADQDAKFNHEFVEWKLAELKKRLEEQKKEQEQKEQQQQEQQQQDQQQEQQEQQGDEHQEQQQQQGQEQQDQGEQGQGEQPQEGQAESAGQGEERAAEEQPQAGGQGGEAQGETQDRRAAHAVLDVARGEELAPGEIERATGTPGGGEPLRDW